jgi:hypothetical protein
MYYSVENFAVPTSCDTALNDYTVAKINIDNAVSKYETCRNTNSNLPPVDKTLQPVPNPTSQRITTVQPLLQTINNQTATYTALITSTKALIAATQPLIDYKTILQGQLDATGQQNQTLQQQIVTDANLLNQTMASIPDLSNAGPFGTANVQSGVSYAFLSFYSFFFILLSVLLYWRFKNSFPKSLLITGIVIMLLAAGAGAYFCAISSNYGLGLVDPQSFIVDTSNAIASGATNAANTVASGTTNLGNTIASGTTNLGNTIASGATDAVNTIASGTTNLGNTIASGATDLGNTIASGTTNLGNTIASGTTNLGNTIASGTTNLFSPNTASSTADTTAIITAAAAVNSATNTTTI